MEHEDILLSDNSVSTEYFFFLLNNPRVEAAR